jgi:hypothetical protein
VARDLAHAVTVMTFMTSAADMQVDYQQLPSCWCNSSPFVFGDVFSQPTLRIHIETGHS